MSWHIVSDSSCDLIDLAPLQTAEASFATVPLKIIVGNREYVDQADTDVAAMLEHMGQFKGPATSACPSPAEFLAEFRKADKVLVFAMTGALSGTYNCACQARAMALEEDPTRQIFVLDSHATAGVLLLLTRRAQQGIAKGLSFEEVCADLEEYNTTMRMLFALGSYDNLIKTGRMSKVAGLMANALNIRAVAANTTPGGTIEVVEKPRGMDKAIERIVALVESRKGSNPKDLPMVISHCDNLAGAQQLKAKLEERYGAQVTILACRCLTAFYTGKTGLLLSF